MRTRHSVVVQKPIELEGSNDLENPVCMSFEVLDRVRVDVYALPVWGRMMETLLPHMENLAAYLFQHEVGASYGKSTKHRFIVDCVLSNDAEIRILNVRYQGKDTATNVLSFPQESQRISPTLNVQYSKKGHEEEEPFLLGGVILAKETVYKEAQEQNKSVIHHCLHLILHGILHLLGFDHETACQAQEMETVEGQILALMHIPNPYSVC
ncbi:MAG: rRNA maturation RNase YbeY [Holosporales bacterium]|jgi:probable rRNA maturation factor|nr:rRNA maturation RNase YbeY [Holosporales bacterium]